MPRRRLLECYDCRVDTSNATGIGHYYMLDDEVWQRATRDTARIRWLCLDCLEARLGRPLRSTDFMFTPREMYQRLHRVDGEHTVLPERERQRWLDYWRAVPRHQRPAKLREESSMPDNLVHPVHVGTINDKPVRFYRPQSGDDMMPWVAAGDLCQALAMNRLARRALQCASNAQPAVAKRVRTEDGTLTELLAFQGVQGLMRALIELRFITEPVHFAVVQQVIAAAERASPELFDRDASGEMRISSRVIAMLLGEQHQAIIDRIQSEGLAVEKVTLQ